MKPSYRLVASGVSQNSGVLSGDRARIVPAWWDQLSEAGDNSPHRDNMTTHPSSVQRALFCQSFTC